TAHPGSSACTRPATPSYNTLNVDRWTPVQGNGRNQREKIPNECRRDRTNESLPRAADERRPEHQSPTAQEVELASRRPRGAGIWTAEDESPYRRQSSSQTARARR